MKVRYLVRNTGAVALLLLLLFLFLAVVVPWQARGDDEEEFKPTIVETKSITLDELGNGKIVNTVQYRKDSLYEKVSKLAKKYKNFISRHYGREDTLKVIENFKQKIDDANKRIVLTYDSPGYAYNWGDYWSIGGMKEFELVKKTRKSLVFKEDYDGRSDLTYYTTQPIRSFFKYTAPKGATSLQFDEDRGRVKYNMAPPPPGFFNKNKAWLSAMFGALSVLFICALGFVVVKTRRKPAAAASPAPAAASAPPPTPAAAPAPAEPAAVEKESVSKPRGGKRTCGKCGKKIPEGNWFCDHCGEPL